MDITNKKDKKYKDEYEDEDEDEEFKENRKMAKYFDKVEKIEVPKVFKRPLDIKEYIANFSFKYSELYKNDLINKKKLINIFYHLIVLRKQLLVLLSILIFIQLMTIFLFFMI